MRVYLILVCVCFTALVAGDDVSEDYKARMFALSTDPTKLRHSVYYSTSMYDYSGDCCNNNVPGCSWYKYPSYSYQSYFKYYYNYPRRGCYSYYGNSYGYNSNDYTAYLVYCLCNQQQVCTAPATLAATTPTTAAPTTTTVTVTTTMTTTAPTTTTTTPTTTTTTPTTTTTVTTTTATLRYCPATASTNTTTRLLGGTAITTCEEFPGLVGIFGQNNTYCTGVITGPTTLSIPNNCAFFANGASFVAQDGQVSAEILSVPASTAVSGPVEVTLTTPISTTSCPGVACVYSAAMASAILLDTCRIAAAGYDANTVGANFGFSYLSIPSLQPTADCPSLISGTSQAFLFDFTNTAITYNCFIDPDGSTCQGDIGAPVVCDLTTGEQVVIGQAESFECSAGTVVGFYNLETSSAVRVLKATIAKVSLG